MSVIPAKIAGCEKIILCTPPDKEGGVNAEILWTAQFLGVHEVYKVGGAQAIFAMTYGTKQIPQADKIFGPGNQFVTAAKILASQKVAIDMPAGPSEVLVIADENSNPAFVASDLLSQAEHGTDSQSVLVCTDEDKIDEILSEVAKQLDVLPRKEMAAKSLESSFAVITKNREEAVAFSNIYAPEHLILSLDNWQELIPKIKNAGSVFCGPYSAESFGDYASGTNHILPTSGFARNFSGVSVDSFVKKVTFQEVTKTGLKNLGRAVEIMAEKEELFAHRNAVSIRLK
jgi:histidinol dehydrogenase